MIVLMQCVAEAVMHKGIRGLTEFVPGATYLYEVANDTARHMKERKRFTDLRDEVTSAAAATLDEVKRAAAEVAREVAAAGPVEDRIALEMYLTQIPGAIRQSLKRPDDPSGKTLPADFKIDDATDLLRHLPQRVAHFRPGDLLPGKPGWKLVEFLGSGGFGEVWLARNPTLSALQGAVKFGLDPAARERLLRHEGSLINRVMEHGRHPNVVQLLDAHLEGDSPWLMYEYVSSGDLGGLVRAWQSLPLEERVKRVAASLQTLATAVGHFHRLSPPLVHRDLKPANVLLASGGSKSGEAELKIADFGIGGIAAAASLAKEASRKGSTQAALSQLAGSYTPLYASPQQQRGEPPDPRDDVHALGVIGFQMLTGKLDATLGTDYAKTLRRLGVSEPLIELLGDCAAHDPENRPKDANELAEKLARLVAAKSEKTDKGGDVWLEISKKPRPASSKITQQPEPDESPRRGWRAILASLLFVILVVGGIVGWYVRSLPLTYSARPTTEPSERPPPSVVPTQRFEKPEFLREERPVNGEFSEVRLSPDGERIAALETGPQWQNVVVRRILPRGSTFMGKLPAVWVPPTTYRGFSWGQGHDRIALCQPSQILICNADTGLELFRIKADDAELSSPLYTVDGKWLVARSTTGKGERDRMLTWDLRSPAAKAGEIIDAASRPVSVSPTDSWFQVDPAGTFFALKRGADSPIDFGLVDGWRVVRTIGKATDNLLCFSPEGGRYATWGGNEILMRDSLTGGEFGRKSAQGLGEPRRLVLSPNQEWVVAIGTTATRAWRVWGNNTEDLPLLGHTGLITGAAFNRSGSLLATLGADSSIHVRETRAIGGLGHTLTPPYGQLTDVQFTPNGTTVLGFTKTSIFMWTVVEPKAGE